MTNLVALNKDMIAYTKKLTYFIRGIITVQMTSCLTRLDLTKQVNLFLIQRMQSS